MTVLGLADHLASGPRAMAELAQMTSTHAPSLARLVRALVAVGLCAYDEQRRVRLTPLGDTLRADAPNSMRAMVLMNTAPWFARALAELPHAMRSGEQTFRGIYGTDFWSYLAAHPEDGAGFDAAMSAGAGSRAAALLAARDLAGIGTVVDVAGGHGQLLALLLRVAPGLRGILADQPGVIAGAPAVLAAEGVAERCQIVAANIFESVPSGGDAYVLAQIIHDWPDAEALAILRTCHQAMAPGVRLWLIERIVPPADAITPEHALFDLSMLTVFGSKERSLEEHRALLEATGFTSVSLTPTNTEWSVVEALRA